MVMVCVCVCAGGIGKICTNHQLAPLEIYYINQYWHFLYCWSTYKRQPSVKTKYDKYFFTKMHGEISTNWQPCYSDFKTRILGSIKVHICIFKCEYITVWYIFYVKCIIYIYINIYKNNPFRVSKTICFLFSGCCIELAYIVGNIISHFRELGKWYPYMFCYLKMQLFLI